MIDRLRSFRPRTRGASTRWTSVAAVLLVVGGAGLVASGTASASTVNGVATIASPGTTTPLTSGGSTDQFTVALPPQAACDGDTATGGYHVYSYLVQQATTLSSVTFLSHPSAGYGLFESNGKYYGPINTAVTTGQVPTLPNDFEWAALATEPGVTLADLLYTGTGSTASGIWDAGIACANSSGALADNWNTVVTFNASSSDPNGFTWTAAPAGSSAPAFTSALSTTMTVGTSGTFTVAASGNPSPTLSETGALDGLTFDATTGVLSGTPTASGSFPITFTATNGVGSPATQSFTLTVSAASATTTTTSTTSPGATTTTTTAGGAGSSTTSTTAATTAASGTGTGSSGTGSTTAATDPGSDANLPFTGLPTVRALGLGLLGIGLGMMLLGWGHRRRNDHLREARRAP